MKTWPIGETLEGLLQRAAGARFVLLGEATHGTQSSTRYARPHAAPRRRLRFRRRRLEADWPDAYRVNCFVRGADNHVTAGEALADFRRFPTWMWRNTVIADLVGKLRTLNTRPAAPWAPTGSTSTAARLDRVGRPLPRGRRSRRCEARDCLVALDTFGPHRWVTRGGGLRPYVDAQASAKRCAA